MTRRHQAGFSVIEALVAVAVIAIALVPLVALQMQVSRDHVRQRAVRAEIAAQRNALASLRDANIMETPQGERSLGAGQIMHWVATPLSRPTRTTDRGTGDGAFEIMLYRVRIDVDLGDGGAPFVFAVEQLGWRPIATSADPRAGESRTLPTGDDPFSRLPAE